MMRSRQWLAASCVLGALLVFGAAVNAQTTGPDAYGYSATAGNAAFHDISVTGTHYALGDDWSTGLQDIVGFNFNLYGASSSRVDISNNGLLNFGSGREVFVWGNDWVGREPGYGVYTQTVGTEGNRQFIVQWNNLDRYSNSPEAVTFQAAFFEGSNDIEFRYLDVVSGRSDTDYGVNTWGIGIRNNQAANQQLWWAQSSSSPVISNGMSVRFSTHVASAVPEADAAALLAMGLLPVARLVVRRSKRRTGNANRKA